MSPYVCTSRRPSCHPLAILVLRSNIPQVEAVLHEVPLQDAFTSQYDCRRRGTVVAIRQFAVPRELPPDLPAQDRSGSKS